MIGHNEASLLSQNKALPALIFDRELVAILFCLVYTIHVLR